MILSQALQEMVLDIDTDMFPFLSLHLWHLVRFTSNYLLSNNITVAADCFYTNP